MKNVILVSILLLIAISLPFHHAKAIEGENKVVFDEIFWTGSFVSTADEFFKLKNTSSENIDLSGWQITYLNSKNEEELMVSIMNGTIPSGGYFLISNSSKDYEYSGGESILNIDPDLIDSGVSLSNSQLELKLYDGTWNDGRMPVDIAGNGKSPLAGDNTKKSSMQRVYPVLDGAQKSSWVSTSNSSNLDIGASELTNPISSGKPSINFIEATPETILLDDSAKQFVFKVKVSDSNGLGDVESVRIDLSNIGQGIIDMKDDGLDGDILGDGEYYYKTEVTGIPAGEKNVSATVISKSHLSDSKLVNLKFYDLSNNIKINEVYPHPAEDPNGEFIEIYNSGDKDINLLGWQIDDVKDGGSDSYQIDYDLIIPSDGFITLYKSETKIGLNDDGDSVRLIDPSGVEKDVLEYNVSKENQSYNRFENEWLWSETITPNSINITPAVKIDAESPKDDLSSKYNQPETLKENITPIRDLDDVKINTQVTVVGYINSLPGMFGSQYFYIEDGTGGVQIYSYKKEFPEIDIGDKVKVTGDLSDTVSGFRIKISTKEDIIVLSKNNELIPLDISNVDFASNLNGEFVSIIGEITDKSGDYFTLDNGLKKLTIYVIKSTGIDKKNYSVGMSAVISGILVNYKNTWRIQPRFSSDISILKKSIPKNENKSINLVSVAHAEETKPSSVIENNITNETVKATEVEKGSILKHDSLIKTVEIVIIISVILLVVLVGDKYAK